MITGKEKIRKHVKGLRRSIFLLSPTTSIPTTYFECLKKIVNGGSNAPVTCDWIEFPVTNICIYSHPNFVSQFEVDANVTHLEDWMVKIRCNP